MFRPIDGSRSCVVSVFLLAACMAADAQPTIGPQIRIDNAAAEKSASETSIAAVVTNCGGVQAVVHAVAAWNDFRGSATRIRAAQTTDGGATWTEFSSPIRPPTSTQSFYEFDPMTATDARTGMLWVGGVWNKTDQETGFFLARKSPCNATFDPSVNVLSAPLIYADKPWMTIGPVPGVPGSARLYIAYNAGSTFLGPAYVVWCDLDAAGQLTGSWSTPLQLAPAGNRGLLPRVRPNGELCITYWDNASYHVLLRSVNGGVSFLPPNKFVHRLDFWNGQFGSGGRIAGAPNLPYQILQWGCLAVSPVDGWLYFIYIDTTSYDPGTSQYNVDIWLTKSPNGTLWTSPIAINIESTPPSDQWHPWLEIDSTNRLHLTYYSGKGIVPDYPPNVDSSAFDAHYHAVYAYSDNGGVTWNEHYLTQHSPTNAPWYTGLFPSQGQVVGHYLGLAVAGDKCIPCYTTTQNTISDPDSDIFVNVITR